MAKRGGAFVVCGGGLTGIEVAAELAESYPSLTVTLISRRAPGDWLSPRAQRYLASAFDRLGIRVRSEVRAVEVREDAVVLADGALLPFDGCLWAGGFTVPTLARETGIAVDPAGRVVVDNTLRSVSHPDVYAIGDAAAVSGPWGNCLAMGCRSGGFTGPHVADVIADKLAGRTPRPFAFRYFNECISLGRKDGLIQFLHADQTPHKAILTGRLAARYKEIVLTSACWLLGSPGPYLSRRRRLMPPAANVLAGPTLERSS